MTAVNKAVGAEYRAVRTAKLARTQARIAQRRAANKTRYFNPSDEQRAAQVARRAQQAEYKAGKQTRRVPGKPTPWISRTHIRPGPAIRVGVAGTVGGAAAYGVHETRRKPVAKADDRKQHTAAATALGGVAGAGAADIGMTVGGQATKAHLKRQRQRVGVSPHDAKVWAAHKAKYGIKGPISRHTPNSVRVALHSQYPKELPGWRMQRALAFKNRPETVAGVLGAGAVAGAAIAHHRHKVSKGGVGHLMRLSNRASVPLAHRQAQNVPPARKKKPHPVLNAAKAPRQAAVNWGQNVGLIGKSAFGVDHDLAKSDTKNWSDEKLSRRKKEQAAIGTTGALIGLGALGAKGAKGGISRLKQTSRTAQIARHLDTATSQALVIGAGIGGVGGLNSAEISRQEARRVKKGYDMTVSAFGVHHELDDISKAKADQLIRRNQRRAARAAAVPPAATPKPAGVTGAVEGVKNTAGKVGGGVLRALKTPQGKIGGLAAAGAAAGGITAGVIAHERNKNQFGKADVSKARADQKLRRARREASSAAKIPPAAPKVGGAVRGGSALLRGHGRLAAIGGGAALAAGGGAAAYRHHRRSQFGKSAFGVDHVIEIEKADVLKPAKAVGTAVNDVAHAFGRGAATASAKTAIRPRAMSAGLAATSNPVQRAAFHTGNATRNFTAGFSRKPPTPEAKALGTHITGATSTNKTAFKAGRLTRQYAVPAAVVAGGAYAGTSLANRHNRSQFGKSAFGVDHQLDGEISKDAVNYLYGPMTARHGKRMKAYTTSLKNTTGGTVLGAGVGAGVGAGTAALLHRSPKAGAGIGAALGTIAGSQAGYTRGYFKNKHAGRFDASEKRPKKKKPGKEVAVSKVDKADRRFNPAPNTKPPLYLARHSTQAGALRQAAAGKKVPPMGAAIRDGLRVTRFGKSAFGVDHELSKAIGYDSEHDRHRRAGMQAGALGVGAAGLATAAAHQGREAVRTGRKAQTAFRTATKGRDAAKVRAGARDAGKLVRATTVHGGRAAGLAAGAAGLAAGAAGVIHHNKNKGRSYNGWYE